VFFCKFAFAAILGGLLINHPANPGTPAFSFTLQDMQPITPPGARVVVSVLRKSRHFDQRTNMAGIITIALNRSARAAVALFTVFDCSRHRFQIQLIGHVTNAANEMLLIDSLSQPSVMDAAMSPVAESPWGTAVEQIACSERSASQ
jgi:hypothetical protein